MPDLTPLDIDWRAVDERRIARDNLRTAYLLSAEWSEQEQERLRDLIRKEMEPC
jgi:hypothetical protein